VPDGVSLVELLCAVVVVAVLATASFTGVTSYNRTRRASQVAGMLEWEVRVARSYAIRSGRPMSLVVDEQSRSVVLRDGASTWRRLSLGDGARLQVDRITLDIPGDSLVFSPRGLCVNCSTNTLADLSVAASGRVARIRIGMLGMPVVAAEDATPGN
jgi:prepilin-type N-terminal cleavage/methylation domain-containing protein